MRWTTAVLLIVGLTCSGPLAVWATHTWYTQTVDDPDPVVGDRSCIFLDAADHPHISYANQTDADLRYAFWDGAQWVIETADAGGTVASGADTSIDLDSAGKAHISYYQSGTAFEDLRFARRDGTNTWHNETVVSAGQVGRFNSLEVDSSDRTLIAYSDETNGELELAVLDDGSWSFETIDSSGGADAPCWLALDSADHPHIAYYDSTVAGVKYTWWNGTSWSSRPSISNASWPSLALDSGGNPHIAYVEIGTRDLGYATWSAGSWSTTIADAGSDLYAYPPIAVGTDNTPRIGYCDWPTQTLKLAVLNGTWVTEPAVSGGVWRNVALALGSQNDPQMSYHEFNRDTLRYAVTQGPLAACWPRD